MIGRESVQLFPGAMSIRHPVLLRDGRKAALVPMPDWAKALAWLGWWTRYNQPELFRMLVVAVLPSRELAAAFAGFGCLLAGCKLFCGGFTWDELRSLPVGSEIFWKDVDKGKSYGGEIFEGDSYASNFVWVRITMGPRKEIGSNVTINKDKFSKHLFCEDKLPSPRRTMAMGKALQLYADIGLELSPRWIVTAGAEARIVTNKTRFRRSIENLQLCVQGSPVAFNDALCWLRDDDNALSKLHVTSNKISEQSFPVSILDGAGAFCQVHEISTGNILIFLDRTEYSSGVHNDLLEARNVASEPPVEILRDIPARLPAGMEIAAFVLRKDV